MHVNRIQVAIREKQNDTNPETNGTLRDLSFFYSCVIPIGVLVVLFEG
jgi:hypothetical protein